MTRQILTTHVCCTALVALVLVSATLVSAPVAQAQWGGTENLYLGVGAGLRSDGDEDGLLDRSRGASIRLGYEFNQMLGAELGYLDVGDSGRDLELDTEAWTASVVVSFPLTAVDLYGRLGAMHLDSETGATLGATGFWRANIAQIHSGIRRAGRRNQSGHFQSLWRVHTFRHGLRV